VVSRPSNQRSQQEIEYRRPGMSRTPPRQRIRCIFQLRRTCKPTIQRSCEDALVSQRYSPRLLHGQLIAAAEISFRQAGKPIIPATTGVEPVKLLSADQQERPLKSVDEGPCRARLSIPVATQVRMVDPVVATAYLSTVVESRQITPGSLRAFPERPSDLQPPPSFHREASTSVPTAKRSARVRQPSRRIRTDPITVTVA